jgi:hypothetical protein
MSSSPTNWLKDHVLASLASPSQPFPSIKKLIPTELKTANCKGKFMMQMLEANIS